MKKMHVAWAFIAILGVALLLMSGSPIERSQAAARFRSTTMTSAARSPDRKVPKPASG